MKKIIKARKIIDQGKEVKARSPLAGKLLTAFAIFAVLVLPVLAYLLFPITYLSQVRDQGMPITVTEASPVATIPNPVLEIRIETSTPSPVPTPVLAVMTGSVWVWDSAEGGEILSAAIPKDAEVVVVEYGLHRTHIIWQGGEARVEGWVNSNWVETVDG